MNNKNSLYYDASKRKKVNLEDYRYEYFDAEVYSNLGKTLFISVEETMEQAANRYSSKKAGSYERAPIKIVEKL